MKSALERRDIGSCLRIVGCKFHQYTDPPDPIGLLGHYLVRPHSGCTAKKRDELAPAHSITSSAIDITPGGMMRSSALAVLRLIRNSYFVACTTGRSAGLSPLRIRPI